MLSIETGLKNYELLLKVGISAQERMLGCKVRIHISLITKHLQMPTKLQECADYGILKEIVDNTKNLELHLLEQFGQIWIEQMELKFKNLISLSIGIEKLGAPLEKLNGGVPFIVINVNK